MTVFVLRGEEQCFKLWEEGKWGRRKKKTMIKSPFLSMRTRQGMYFHSQGGEHEWTLNEYSSQLTGMHDWSIPGMLTSEHKI